ncbi:LysM peptidoglycan-binding domain-containing protein [Alicyclobacillus ferrooxydans]|uniref:Glycoside hydrolase n=1 Tax=Alicyclobacillus ferrooxydans TaxID=471514 RepID=A0A0P9CDT8_9BACL|nr:LysM peptidoglycan-binding domain-containing protein [Alicyclobacillus ferrooxydans]KPV43942.1 hypothetical protein AN477_09465 [Alicyclobacillus ferrooxydans]
MQIHVVRQGESVWSISQQYGVSSQLIEQINQLPSSSIVPEQTLIIPVGTRTYVVMPGDELYQIARRYNLTVSELQGWNPNVQPTNLSAGQILRLPMVSRPKKIVLGFLELTTPTMDRANVLSYGPYSTYLALFTYGMTESGVIVGVLDETALQATTQTRAVPAAVFSNWTQGGFSPDAVHVMLSSPSERQQYISTMLSIVSQKGYKAVVIDFESLHPYDGAAFIQFLRELSARLKPLGLPSIVCVMPITGLSPLEKTTIEAYDYAAIAENTNLVMLMSYNWSWPGGPPGPIAPFQKVEENIRYALARMPRTKILVGLIRYGYDWALPYQPGERTGTIEVQAVVEMAMERGLSIQFDAGSLTPSLTYWDQAGREHVIWFEDARSLQLKLQLVQKYQVAGIAAWEYHQRFTQFMHLLLDNFSPV